MVCISHLYFSYTGSAPFLLTDLNIDISEGSYVSIIGENGAGKTSLMRLLLGFLKPTSGRIALATRAVGYVPQADPTTMEAFPITVGELLYAFCAAKGIRASLRNQAVDGVLECVGMQDRKADLFPNLSGGQRQRVLLSRALLGDNRLLVLDEPSTGVDPQNRKELYALLRSINRNRGMTIIAVEHNLEDATASSTELIHLQEGRAHICSPQAYRKEEHLCGNG